MLSLLQTGTCVLAQQPMLISVMCTLKPILPVGCECKLIGSDISCSCQLWLERVFYNFVFVTQLGYNWILSLSEQPFLPLRTYACHFFPLDENWVLWFLPVALHNQYLISGMKVTMDMPPTLLQTLKLFAVSNTLDVCSWFKLICCTNAKLQLPDLMLS